MKYLITGGSGFIGSHLADALVARGDEVVVLDDLSTGRLENIVPLLDGNRVTVVEGSILDEDLVSELMAEVDGCFHLASAVGVKLIVARPLESLQVNMRGNDIVISAAAAHDKKLLFTSTSEIYGKNSSGALHEDSDRILGSPLKSRWAYSMAKALAESLAHGYHRELGSDMRVVRLFNTVGPRQRGSYGMVLPRFVRQAIAGEDVTVYGTGRQSRCFIHVEDTIRGILAVMDAPKKVASGDVFNIGGSKETPIQTLAQMVIARSGSDSRLRFVPYEEAYGTGFEELGRRMADTTKLRRATGWAPRHSTEDAIDAVIASERAILAREDAIQARATV